MSTGTLFYAFCFLLVVGAREKCVLVVVSTRVAMFADPSLKPCMRLQGSEAATHYFCNKLDSHRSKPVKGSGETRFSDLLSFALIAIELQTVDNQRCPISSCVKAHIWGGQNSVVRVVRARWRLM
jgi:hypothetical protein